MQENRPSRARKIYDRNARYYDLMEVPLEALLFRRWRQMLFRRLSAGRFLEVGVGTGKNIPFYPPGSRPTAIDFSGKMLARARAVASKRGQEVEFHEMDVEHLDFPDHSFEAVVATFVFCSVPDPVQGLREARRVCQPGGRVFLLEHVRPEGYFLGTLFDFLNPMMVRLSGANINRRTVDNIRAAGFRIEREENLFSDIFKFIVARP